MKLKEKNRENERDEIIVNKRANTKQVADYLGDFENWQLWKSCSLSLFWSQTHVLHLPMVPQGSSPST